MLALNLDGPGDVARQIAERARQRRLESDLTQQGLARRAGLSLSTYRRFETTGEISLQHLLAVGLVLGADADFDALFQQRQYANLDEVVGRRDRVRRRGRRND